MSRKKRLLRVGCITLLLLAFVGYFAFSTLLFPPFEGRYKAAISSLVPRTVDLYVARAKLADAFGEFPRLKVLDKLGDHVGLNELLGSTEWSEFKLENGVDEALDQLDQALSKLPFGIEPLSIFGGSEVALAGTFEGKGWDATEWAVYGRVSRVGKLAVAALRYPGLLKLDAQGIQVTRDGDVFTLNGSSFKKPILIARIRDIVIAGTSQELVKQAQELSETGSQDSLLLAATFGERVHSLAGRNEYKRDIEVVLDVLELRQKWGMDQPWPNHKSEHFLESFVGRLVQVGAAKKVYGVVDFDEGLAIDLYGDFSSELITTNQARVYRERAFDHDGLMEIARAAQEDVVFFAYLHGPIGTLLRMAVSSMEPALRDNLTDALRQGQQYKSIDDVITELEGGMHDRLALFARPNDWGDEGDFQTDEESRELILDEDGEPVYIGPPRDEETVFAWTLVTWHEDEARLIKLREYVGEHQGTFGIQGRGPGQPGYWINHIGAFESREFWSRFVPGTGHIATLNLPDHMLVTNRYKMLGEITNNLLQARSSTGRLSERSDFLSLLEEMPQAGNLFLWANPGMGTEVLRAGIRERARDRLEGAIDMGQKRRELDPVVRREVFGGRPRSQLNADEVERLDNDLDQRLIDFRDDVVAQNLPGALADGERTATYMESFSSIMAMLKLSEKNFRLAVRGVVPYD